MRALRLSVFFTLFMVSMISAAADADVELSQPHAALVHGQRVEFDGVDEGLAWPALTKALGRGAGDSRATSLAIGRDVPVRDVLRAVWTLRTGDVQVRTPDASGGSRFVTFRARPSASQPGCHLAVFVEPNHALRLATAGGARTLEGTGAVARLVAALDEARRGCPLRYVAFGAETHDDPWGPVFDLIMAVDAAKAAGDARYVLAEPMRAAGK